MMKSTTKQRRKTGHLFHLVMTCVTGGLWLPVWIYQTVWHKVGPREKVVTRHHGVPHSGVTTYRR